MDRRSFLIGAGLGAAFALPMAHGISAFGQGQGKATPTRRGGLYDFASYGGGPFVSNNAGSFEAAFGDLVAAGGGTLMISTPGRYRFSRACNEMIMRADIAIDIRWGPGARFVGPAGLTMPLLRFRGSIGPERVGTLQLFDPAIDVSQGAFTGNQPSAIHLVNLATVVIDRPKLYGGKTWTDVVVGGDSGIEPINIGDFSCTGGSIEGFADAGIYWGGGNNPLSIDDGGRILVEGTTFRHCQTGIIGKRNGYLGVVRNCYLEHCGIGIGTAEAGPGQDQEAAQRLDVQGCVIKCSSFRAVEFRAKTWGKLVANVIEDWGYSEDGKTLLPAPNQRCAIYLNGSSDVDVSGNSLRIVDWVSQDHIGVVEDNYLNPEGIAYQGGGNFGQGNIFTNVPIPLLRAKDTVKQSAFHICSQEGRAMSTCPTSENVR